MTAKYDITIKISDIETENESVLRSFLGRLLVIIRMCFALTGDSTVFSYHHTDAKMERVE